MAENGEEISRRELHGQTLGEFPQLAHRIHVFRFRRDKVFLHSDHARQQFLFVA
ncbi:MAG: hypothetical protein H0X31_21065 [Nostocaceae cyanobacterium]|nr:hypothetical protein [Nostocaceae cyanobacterium]